MWREELGLVEMLLTYIGDFVKFKSYADWRPVLVDILTSHEEVRRRRLIEATEYSDGSGVEDNVVDDVVYDTRQSYNESGDQSVLPPTREVIANTQSLIESSYSTIQGEEKYSIERNCQVMPERAFGDVKVDEEVMVKAEIVDQQTDSQCSDESVVCLEIDSREMGNDNGLTEVTDENAASIEIDRDLVNRRAPGTFDCSLCGKSFVKRWRLKRHMVFHGTIRSYKCSKCDKSYFQKCDLTKHMRNHNGERPFTCQFCGKSFPHKTNLKVHMRVVHYDDRPFSCKFCEKSFHQLSGLKCHTHSCHNSSAMVTKYSC